MYRLIRSLSLRIIGRGGLAAAGVIACLALPLAGCNQDGSIEAILEQQKAGDYEGSIEPLRELLAENPDDAQTNFLYGRALAFTQPHLAVWSLRKAMQDPEWMVPAGTQLAFLALAGLDFNEVIKITGQILEIEPDNVRVLMMRANAYAHSRLHPEKALADARRMLELDPKASEAYEPLILALLSLDKLDEASEALKDAGRLLVELESDEGVLAWHCATTAAFEQASNDLEAAGRTWIRCLDAHSSDMDVVTSALNFYDAQGERERSLEILRAAVGGDPASGFFRMSLAQRLRASGDTAEAEALLREATHSEDSNTAAEAWAALAKFEQAPGEYGAAADAMEQAIELVRKEGEPSPQLLFEYADALVLAGRLERALEVAGELTVPAHRQLIRGRVAQERRQPEQALKEFDEALRLWPDNPWARYYAALAAEEMGDFARAITEYRNAVRIEAAATDARTRGAALLLAEGNSSSALIMIQTAAGPAPLEIEGLLLAMHLTGRAGDSAAVAETLALIEARHPAWAGHGLAEAAEGLAELATPNLAVQMLATAPGVDFNEPRYAEALRALVRFSHQAGGPAETQAGFRTILDTHLGSSLFQGIRGLDLELSGAPVEEVRAAYSRAVELSRGNADALAGLGRLSLTGDPEAALAWFDRAAEADPSDWGPKLEAAKILVTLGRPDEAAERLDTLLLEHPFAAEAAAERARLDLEMGNASPETLERARRAVRFGGGADAADVLARVREQLEGPSSANSSS